MTISVWGWGSTMISTWGWGSWIYEYVPEPLADYICSGAHSCVIDTWGCIEITELSTSQVVMRLRPCEVGIRERGDVLETTRPAEILVRERGDVLERTRDEESIRMRSGGWPHESEPCLDDE